MPFKQTWYIQDLIVKVEFYGDLTVEDIAQSFIVSGKLLKESTVSHVHFIHDWSGIERYPTNPHEIRRSLNRPSVNLYEKIGGVVVYGVEKEQLRFIGDLTFQFFQIHCHMTDSLASALHFLRQQDTTLSSYLDDNAVTEVNWQIPGYVLYCKSVWNPDQMIVRNRNALQLIESEGKPPYVHMLIDYTTSDAIDDSSDVRSLIRWSTSSDAFKIARDNLLHHPLFGWVIAVGKCNPNIKISGKILSARHNYKRKEVDSVEEALTFLKQIDPNIACVL